MHESSCPDAPPSLRSPPSLVPPPPPPPRRCLVASPSPPPTRRQRATARAPPPTRAQAHTRAHARTNAPPPPPWCSSAMWCPTLRPRAPRAPSGEGRGERGGGRSARGAVQQLAGAGVRPLPPPLLRQLSRAARRALDSALLPPLGLYAGECAVKRRAAGGARSPAPLATRARPPSPALHPPPSLPLRSAPRSWAPPPSCSPSLPSAGCSWSGCPATTSTRTSSERAALLEPREHPLALRALTLHDPTLRWVKDIEGSMSDGKKLE